MIRFKCIYCGQRIFTRDDSAGKKGKCPKCKYELVVPKSTKSRPAISTDIPEKPQKAREAVASLNTAKDLSGDIAELYAEKLGWLIPTYDELSLFLMAAALILLFVTNNLMRDQICKTLATTHHYRNPVIAFITALIIAVYVLIGTVLSIYHIFTKRKKTKFEKGAMLYFAAVANAGTGIISGWYVIQNSEVHNWQIVFPIWNIINGHLVLFLHDKVIKEGRMSDREATIIEVILGLAAVLIIFLLCNYVFKLYWAVTFSICMVYITSFDRALQNVFARPDVYRRQGIR